MSVRLTITLFLLFPFLVMAQGVEDSLQYREKVYLHTDQFTYVTGEYLWFSAYVTESNSGAFSNLSKVLYVELLDRNNQPKLQSKIYLDNGTGSGSFFLPSSLSSEVYQLRAYTRWMRNFPAESFFYKTVAVFNPFLPVTENTVAESPGKPEIRFRPEGGRFVDDIPNKVAFRVTDNQGAGIPFRGLLRNNENDTIAYFNPMNQGLGSFSFVPEPGMKYNAVIKDVYDSVLATADLPNDRSVLAVSATKTGSGYKIDVRCPSCRDSESVIVDMYPGTTSSTEEKLLLSGGRATMTIANEDIPSGIQLIRVRLENGKSSSRKILAMPEEGKVMIETDREHAGSREIVSYTISTEAMANLSVSVYRVDSLMYFRQSGMHTILNFSGDLGKNTEDPNYFFSGGEAAAVALESLLILDDEYDPAKRTGTLYPEYRGQTVQLTVGDNDGHQYSGIPVHLSIVGDPFVFRTGISDSSGRINFLAGDIEGDRKVVLRPANRSDSLLTITLGQTYSGNYPQRYVPVFDPGMNLKNSIEARSLAMQMENIYYGAQRGRLSSVKNDSLPFYGRADKSYLLDDYTRFPSMLDVMKEYVPNVAARKRDKKYIFRILNEEGNFYYQNEPLVLLDGVPVMNTDKMIKYDPLLVRQLDVVSTRYIHGPMTYDGIVSYTTYKGNMEGFPMPENVLIEDFQGVQYERKFFQPAYDSPDRSTDRKPDMRHLLYWNPSVVTSDTGSISGSFYTSDLAGTYIIEVQGMTSTGKVVTGSQTFVVGEDVN